MRVLWAQAHLNGKGTIMKTVWLFDLHVPGVPEVVWRTEYLTKTQARETARYLVRSGRRGTRCEVRPVDLAAAPVIVA